MNRKNFLKSAGLFSGTALLGSSLMNKATAAAREPLPAFGLQLYTLRDTIGFNPKLVIAKVAEHGYKQIEGYDGGKGIFWGMQPTEFKSFIDGLGISMVSSHCNWNKDFEKLAADAATVGLKYLIAPYLGKQNSLDDYKKAADNFNDRGRICKANGLKFAYHNHDYTFVQQDGQFPQDVLMQNTDSDLVDYEMDIYWVVAAGQDPDAWFKKYPGRFKLGHVKDRLKDAPVGEHNASTILGTGSLDFPKIIKKAKDKGMEYFIVEQERYDGVSQLGASYRNALYMQSVKI